MTNAILPIRPNYVEAILAGDKKVEFRRTRFKRTVSHILIYASTPVKRVVGYFKVGSITELSPVDAWNEFGALGAIDYEAFMAYYSGAEIAYVISIRDVVCFSNYVMLSDMSEDLSAPQSYRYLSNELFDKAKAISSVAQ